MRIRRNPVYCSISHRSCDVAALWRCVNYAKRDWSLLPQWLPQIYLPILAISETLNVVLSLPKSFLTYLSADMDLYSNALFVNITFAPAITILLKWPLDHPARELWARVGFEPMILE